MEMTISEMIHRYDIRLADQPGMLRVYNAPLAKKEGAIDIIKERKPEMIAVLERRAAEAAEKERLEREHRAERARRIEAIEGLAEIRAARDDLARWHAEFEASFEGEDAVGGMGVRPKPQYDIPAMLEAHPRASAFLKAEELANKSNYELSAIGRKALEEVIFGDYKKALEDMEAEREAFVARHIWD